MLEMEWTHAYANKTPKAEDFRNAMLAAGLQQCPADFQEAWLRQTTRPGRNYAAHRGNEKENRHNHHGDCNGLFVCLV